jgi:hypothetical protein
MAALTRQQLLLIQEMCINGEQRCDQRAADARTRQDYHRAASELQLKKRYTHLKLQMMEELTRPTVTSPDAVGNLRPLARALGTQDVGPGTAEQGSKPPL